MIISSRKSPRLSLRPGSFNSLDRGPKSSTSSRFNFNHLMVSPPPSPGLPALVPRHGKKPTPTRAPRRYMRVFCWMVGVVLILYYGSMRLQLESYRNPVGWAAYSGVEYEMVEESVLPDYPTPVVVTDQRGKVKWTVSIPPDHEFPLEPKQYAEICQQNTEVASRVSDLHAHLNRQHFRQGYYHVDKNFMDVAEAEAYGLLPGLKAKTTMKEDGSLVGINQDGLIDSGVCEKTLTFLMETSDASLGKTLMMIWTAYGLAQKERRQFFVDDSRWAYGKYTDYFKPPPIPACRPPPRHEMLPCPHQARHLVVSAATAAYTFGSSFKDEFENSKKMEVDRQKALFALARAGYQALFHLNHVDQKYVDERATALLEKTIRPPPEDENGMIIGVHVRHGDRHPFEYQYKDSYIPLDVYGKISRELVDSALRDSGKDGEKNQMAERHTIFVLASDDPDVYDSEEFSHAERAQELIRLASKKSSESAQQPASAIRKWVDENVGWEGGFFAGMFWSLGKPTSVPVTAIETPTTKLPPTDEALRLRQLVGRAYLLDIAVLGTASDRIICTVSSVGCKMLAVMMGWENAMEKKKWVNIDGDFSWTGVDW
ncbi:uncharacterized protein L3040_009220 [Drepanopeziza brunnea f. sp. 'multigermtubi']|uniref:Uncharacterized protein n=1 Tax=Marssonina brunnea f. sp. multigermtubi (strain MB_m1) TaxID=1072389 RepID=K1WNT1_MARBU|nr:uncharacterized protein MBM_02577 [Drepanopeziza brunnea f. sp. 'multigermtubi' MB_m1]EKD19340.1 hypothetical protein MBM_02577 [Drepanopeziza brunnea f. sp. 'multigermtubi' MB_m1]KAJ5032623.1 hypothetical protein L3040_009220 [Drepanopeziza brunnea f. sp. 'multigermtubi']